MTATEARKLGKALYIEAHKPYYRPMWCTDKEDIAEREKYKKAKATRLGHMVLKALGQAENLLHG